MKIINFIVVVASLFAIAGAALFQFFVLVTNKALGQQTYNRRLSG